MLYQSLVILNKCRKIACLCEVQIRSIQAKAKSQWLRANSFPNLFQLPLHRTVVNRAAYSYQCAAEQGCVESKLRANFFASDLFNLRFEPALLIVAQFTGAGHPGLGKSHARIE